PHTAKFETMLKSIAPGDPATAIEVLALREYTEAEMNTLLTPQSVRLASREEDSEPLPWGGWYVRPHVRKVVPVHKDNGMLYAIGGFLVAGLGALALWVIGSTLSSDGEENGSGLQVAGDTSPIAATDVDGASGVLPPARNAPDLENCALNADGSITGAPCRLTANIAPLIDPETGELPGSSILSTLAGADDLESCIVSLGGAIENTPCKLSARYVPPAITVPDEVKPPCTSEEDGSILNVPCTLEGEFRAPLPERVEVEVPVEREPEPLCAVNADGSISDTPCMLARDLDAPEPERVEVLVPADAPVPDACIVGSDGAIFNAPCLVASPVSGIEPERIEVPGDTVVQVEELPTCRGLIAGREIEEGCKLEEDVQLAYLPCNEDMSNAPCTLERQPTRFAAGDEVTSRPSGTTDRSTGSPSVAAARPARGDFPPRPLNMPESLEPCEEVINAPCRFTVERAGLDTLTEIAESYYGNTQAWCRIYRANENTFGTRNRPRRSSDPNCIFMSDVFDLPPANADNRYSLRGCPPAQPNNRCGAPAD
ncbi:MAG: hypothetical protein AAFO57_07490, partial [Pseudomonadota bacterium]